MTDTCIVCHSPLRFWVCKLERDVFRCPTCGHIQVPAGLARTASGLSIYEDPRSVFCSDGNEEYYLDESASLAARVKAAFVRRYAARGGSLLDIGAGFGHFLAAVGSDYDATGIELSSDAVKWAGEHFNVSSRVGSVYGLATEPTLNLDVITGWDVIEHLEDPRAALRRIRAALKPHGRLFLSTPDAGSAVARIMGERWHYLDPIQHLNLFSRTNLGRVVREEGFAVLGWTSFGRSYRIGYVVNRLRYLAGPTWVGSALGRLGQTLPTRLSSGHVHIKLWDVMGLAAEKVD